MISQARLDDIKQSLNLYADRRTVEHLVLEIERLNVQVAHLEATLLEIPEDYAPETLDGKSLYFKPEPDGPLVRMVSASQIPLIKAQALREAAIEMSKSDDVGWSSAVTGWLRRRAQRVAGETVGG